MIQNKANKSSIEDWLPRKKFRESIKFETLWLTIIMAIFTLIFILLGSPEDSKPSSPSPLVEIGSVLSSIMFGFLLNNCWKEWENGNSDRREARKISDEVNQELDRNTAELQQQLNSLTRFSGIADHQAASFFLSQQHLRTEQYIQKKARDIDNLGYDARAFLKEKRERFLDIRKLAKELVSRLSSSVTEDIGEVWDQFADQIGGGLQLIGQSEESRSPDTGNPKNPDASGKG